MKSQKSKRVRRLVIGGLVAVAWGAALVALPGAAEAESVGVDRIAVKRAAARIDSLVEAALKAERLAPGPLADEEIFVRRTYLAVVGRIPTLAELRDYRRSSASDKRLRLIDSLLGSRGYESHQFNWWADLLRTRSRLPRRVSGEPYIHWVKEAIATNRPYDEMVRELLTATGPIHQRGNGATGYLMRDRNMPEDNMSNTIRLFLGSRVECAQCHNHPFDKWTQRQYFEMVAFTGGIRYRQDQRRAERPRALAREAKERWGRNGLRALRRTMEPLSDGIYGSGTATAQLPKDYQYDDASPHDWVTATPLFAPEVSLEPGLPDDSKLRQRLRNKPKKLERALRRLRPREVDSRPAFAQWLTAPDNERFATVIANRVWQRLLGRGLIEPVDDIKDSTKPVAPELMAHLTKLMVELDFDLREFQRAVLYTRLWQRAAVVPAATPGSTADLRGPVLRRMSAEQAWDSLLTLVLEDPDAKLAPPLGPRTEEVYASYEELADASDEELLERTGRLALRYSNPEEYREQQRRARAEKRDAKRKLRRAARPLLKEYQRAKKAGDLDRMAELAAQLREQGVEPPGSRAGRAVRDLARASDLPSPTPDGHLLRELGQSERDLIEAGHTDPTVPQILALLNAFLEQRLLTNRQAALSRSLAGERGGKEKVRTAFLAVLGRTPTPAERSLWERDVQRGGDRAAQDLVWTLVNTHEFLFIQ